MNHHNTFEPEPENESAFLPELPPWYEAYESNNSSETKLKKSIDPEALDEDQLKAIIHQAFKRIQTIFPNYESRENQLNMSFQALKTFYFNKTAFIEAGTGIGKSFAYLAAALAFSYLRGMRVFITTETKNLQMQIFEKDLRFIQKALDPRLSYSLCLGSGNYLCRLRYEETMQTGSFRDIISDKQYTAFSEWADEIFSGNKEGNIYEAPNFVRSSFWSLVNRVSDGCPGHKCMHYEECNYFKTRNRWQKNRIMVGNHHLLLFHLQNEKKLIPEYGAVVIDEAHALPSAAQSIFSLTFHINSLSDQKKISEKTIFTYLDTSVKNEFEKIWENAEKLWNIFFSGWQNYSGLLIQENANKIILEDIHSETGELKKSLEDILEIISSECDNENDPLILNNYGLAIRFISRLIHFVRCFFYIKF